MEQEIWGPEGRPRGAHLVGSVPLDGAETVFRAVASRLGGHLRRIPDGETGERANWVGWQAPLFAAHPDLEAHEPDADERPASSSASWAKRAPPAPPSGSSSGCAQEALSPRGRASR